MLHVTQLPFAAWLGARPPRLGMLGLRTGPQGRFVSHGFAALTLDHRSSDHMRAGYRGRPSCGRLTSPQGRRDRPVQSSRARAADAAARAASPVVSQPMPANRHDPTTSVVSSSSAPGPGRPIRRPAGRCPEVLAAGVVAAGLAEPAEGGGVAAGLGGEVAAEAEHVDPPAPALVRAVRCRSARRARPQRQTADDRLEPAQVRVGPLSPGRGRRRLWWRTSRHTRRRSPGARWHRSGSSRSAGRGRPGRRPAAPNRSRRTRPSPSTGGASHDDLAGGLDDQLGQHRPRSSCDRGRRDTARSAVGGPSSRIRAWKWMTPRRWNSATFANWTRTSCRHAVSDTPRCWASCRRRPMVNRRHSSGRVPLPHQMPGIVVAVDAQRLARPTRRCGRGRPCTTAADRADTAADALTGAGPAAAAHRDGRASSPHAPARTTVRSGWRTPTDASATSAGHVLHPAGGAGHDHVVDVALVLVRTRRTHRPAPVPAPQIRHPVRLRRSSCTRTGPHR